MDVNSYPAGGPLRTREDFVEVCNVMDATKHLDPDLIQKDINILFNSQDLSMQQKAARRLNLVGDDGWKYLVENVPKWVHNGEDITRDIYFVCNVDIVNEAHTNINLLMDKSNSAHVRSSAAAYFTDEPASFAIDILIDTVLFDDTPEVRAAAVMSLIFCYCGQPRVKEILLQSLEDNDEEVRETVKNYRDIWDKQ